MKEKRSILLVHPSLHARSTLKAENFVRFQPLGLAYIAASTPDGWSVRLIDESCQDIDDLSKYAIVGISTNTRMAPRAYELAAQAKRQGCYTVAGGIHASMRLEEALGFFDTVIKGEGERLWREFLMDFESRTQKRVYESSSFESMDAITFPDRSIMGDFYPVRSIQTSRGCPFNCSFCSVTSFNGKRFRQRHVEGVLNELEDIEQRNVFFVDDNLIGCGRSSLNRARRIFQGMIKRNLNKRFIAQATMNFGLEDQLLELAFESGCRGVFIGVESIDTDVLKHMNKSINLKTGVNSYKKIFNNIQRHGISVIATLTFGNDEESPGLYRKIIEFIDESEVDAVQMTITTPLPGTRLFEQLARENRIIFDDFPSDWVHYSLGSLVFVPKFRSADEIASEWRNIIDSTYTLPKIFMRALRSLKHTKSFSSAYVAYRLNKAYREGYKNSLFYNSPPLEKYFEAKHASTG